MSDMFDEFFGSSEEEEVKEEQKEEKKEKKVEEKEETKEEAEKVEEEPKEEKPEEKPKEETKEDVKEPPKPVTPDVDIQIKEAEPSPKTVFMIYGLKGHGKTSLAFSFPGSIVCLSFDRKSAAIKAELGRKDIRVFDAVEYMDYSSPIEWLKTAEITFEYINKIFDYIETSPPDWIVIDGSELFEQICEMVMRYRNNLMPFQGVANRNLWKERRMYIRQIHHRALSIAKKGLIWTTYTDKDEIVVDGELVAKKDVPRWIDAIMTETDVVIRVRSTPSDTGMSFWMEVESSKRWFIPTGLKLDVTLPRKNDGRLDYEKSPIRKYLP